jgi:anthranilate synthase/aminodeoxychorismate synthase-like glutamine amidotransferase
MMILVIDNYDSFTYNLVQYIGEIIRWPEVSESFPSRPEIVVFRNDAISTKNIDNLAPSHIIISPGPCTPNEAGISLEVVSSFSGKIPILGVCLGHQAIGQAFGGKVVRAPIIMHGKTSKIFHNNDVLFQNIPSPFTATRYHSLIIDRTTCPECLEITAWTDDLIMAVRHKDFPVWGVQFHPESILTEHGKTLLKNFLLQRA